jgi:hypothetical protein
VSRSAAAVACVLTLAACSALPADPAPDGASSAPDLVFGADVQLGEGSGAGAQDNGDNVVQRGLFADQDQLKLQVDKHVPSCTVRTPRLRAFVKLTHAMDDGWQRLSCRYDGVTLDLTATRLGGAGAAPEVVSSPAAAGALSFASSTDISVGGKVTADGALVKTQPDQFNGVLDNVFVSTSP